MTQGNISGLALLRQHEDLHHQSKVSRGKLSPSDRKSVNRDLRKIGMDGNGRFRSMGQALGKAAGVLHKHGIEWDEVITADRVHGKHGSTAFTLAHSDPDEPMAPKPVTNSMFSVQWTEMRGGYEVVAYVS
jgi:hypothetical protein